MNPFEKIYCRAFQFIFRAALPILPYREPRELESLEDVPALLRKLEVRSVLLVTDGTLREAGLTAPLETLLADNGIRCPVFDGVMPNPTVRNVEAARELYLREGCQALIAFGGGSSMDCAKAAGARIVYPRKSVNRMKGILRVLRRLPPLIAVPTTAGTGSEVTLAAVITDSDRKHKYPINSFALIPHYCVLDPTVTYTLPPAVTATTGMDALTHAVEAYIGGSTTRETRSWAREAVRLIFENIETADRDGTNFEPRKNMLHAANRAGSAFSQSYVGYVHAVAHSLGGQYGVPHGLANAVLLPVVLEAYGTSAHKKLSELAEAAGLVSEGISPAEGAGRFIAAVRELNRRMDIPEKLPGIQREDIPLMARHAHREANPLYPVPKLMDAAELEKLYYCVADWSEYGD